ncbi:MAG: hypothetical protein ACRYE9_02225 [Janthinobacterium lividum]
MNNPHTKLDPKLIEFDIDSLIKTCLHELAFNISDSFLLVEVTCLYKNKIYDDEVRKDLSYKIDCLSEGVNLIVSKYLERCKNNMIGRTDLCVCQL